MFCRFWAIWRAHGQRQLGGSTGVFYPFYFCFNVRNSFLFCFLNRNQHEVLILKQDML